MRDIEGSVYDGKSGYKSHFISIAYSGFSPRTPAWK